MNYKNKYVPFLLGLSLGFGIFIGDKLDFSKPLDGIFTSNTKKEKLNKLINFINYEYVDDVNTDSIVDVAVNNILNQLDPHSTYIPAKYLNEVTDNMKGDFVGIGVVFYIYKDTVTVIRPIEYGPAIEKGIKRGDRIIEADGIKITGAEWNTEKIINTLKGERGSKVKLKIFRPESGNSSTVYIKRNDVPIISVDAAYMLQDKVGYIKINRFAESTYKEFNKGLNTLIQSGADKLILDLRDNPGGFLTIAEQIVDEFLEEDKLILFTKNKKGRIDKSYATEYGNFESGEIYVLINENSASASEIIAGALQDNDKGLIIGRRSFGKGLVQREMEMGDGSAVRLTIARYYTPTGRSIQRPYTNGNQAYYHDYIDRIDNGELSNKSKILIADSLKYTTPKGKIVYGGGGIVPDVFIPINPIEENQAIARMRSSGTINYFSFEQIDKNRKKYNHYTEDEFIDNFVVTNQLFNSFQTYLNQNSQINLMLLPFKREVKLYLKAAMADMLFGRAAYLKVLNKEDKMIESVLNLIRQ